jgi:mono/diheme cytochrome c family protein
MHVFVIGLAVAAALQSAPDPGESLFRANCSGCHEPALAIGQRNTPAQWRAIVQEMADRGAPGSDEDLAQVRDYLVRIYGRIEINRLGAADLVQYLRLPPAQAEAIVRRRAAQGPIKTFDDLVAIQGLEIERLRPYQKSFVY